MRDVRLVVRPVVTIAAGRYLPARRFVSTGPYAGTATTWRHYCVFGAALAAAARGAGGNRLAFAEDKTRCFGAGMSGFLSKPFNPGKLFATLIDLRRCRNSMVCLCNLMDWHAGCSISTESSTHGNFCRYLGSIVERS